MEVLPTYLLMKRPKKDVPTFPYGYRFSIDTDAIGKTENPQVQSSPINDYVKNAFKFMSIDDMDKEKKEEFLAKISGIFVA